MNLQQALRQNVGKLCSDGKQETQVEGLHECESSEAEQSDGAVHRSDEASVMGAEQRDCPMRLEMKRQLETE